MKRLPDEETSGPEDNFTRHRKFCQKIILDEKPVPYE
jgi:hypothetical protein